MIRTKPLRNDKIVELRIRGLTLEETGKIFGLTRERVRQLLVKKLGSTDFGYVSESRLAKLVGCSSIMIRNLRKAGEIIPDLTKHRGNNLVCYYYPTIAPIIENLLLSRKCPYCGNNLPIEASLNRKFCDKCKQERRRYPYPFYLEKLRKRFRSHLVGGRRIIRLELDYFSEELKRDIGRKGVKFISQKLTIR